MNGKKKMAPKKKFWRGFFVLIKKTGYFQRERRELTEKITHISLIEQCKGFEVLWLLQWETFYWQTGILNNKSNFSDCYLIGVSFFFTAGQ